MFQPNWPIAVEVETIDIGVNATTTSQGENVVGLFHSHVRVNMDYNSPIRCGDPVIAEFVCFPLLHLSLVRPRDD